MLTVKDLIDINFIPKEEEVSLELLKEFYEDYLCKNIYLYTLMDGSEIKLILRDSTEIFQELIIFIVENLWMQEV